MRPSLKAASASVGSSASSSTSYTFGIWAEHMWCQKRAGERHDDGTKRYEQRARLLFGVGKALDNVALVGDE
jgi:hypothetical protein